MSLSAMQHEQFLAYAAVQSGVRESLYYCELIRRTHREEERLEPPKKLINGRRCNRCNWRKECGQRTAYPAEITGCHLRRSGVGHKADNAYLLSGSESTALQA